LHIAFVKVTAGNHFLDRLLIWYFLAFSQWYSRSREGNGP